VGTIDVLSGARRGIAARVARLGLGLLTPLYRLGLALRSLAYAIGLKRRVRVDVPVVSVGNLTTGGTGKTPLVSWVVARLRSWAATPGVVSRGYRRAEGEEASDEAAMLREELGSIIHVENPDRVRGAGDAIGRGADVIVLDDAFQHWRIRRDLDLVTIDATRPFGFGRLLPRGLLREPVGALRRAGVIVVTRADAVDRETLAGLRTRLERIAPGVPVAVTRHAPLDPPDLAGRRVLAVSGVGHPAAFEATLERLGAKSVVGCRFRDHHAYDAADLDRMRAAAEGVDLVVTTAKDEVKLRPLREASGAEFPVPWHVLRIAIEFLDGVEAIDAALGRLVQNIAGRDSFSA